MVIRMFVLLFMLVAGTADAQTSGAYIKLSLDSDTVYLGDTVVLDVESTGLLDPLDLSPITQYATLERETTGTRIAVVKGKVVEIAIRRMDLTPKNPGMLIIGPIMSGPVRSNSVHVNVLNATRPNWQPEPDDLSVSINASPTNPYVGQQVTLDIVLKHRYPINSEKVVLPSLTEFATRVQKEQIRTTNQEKWFEVRWRYFIFPNRSGAITLDPVLWTGNMTKTHSQRADFERRSTVLKLDVLPAAGDQWWLPSRRVEMKEVWSQPATTLRAGDELERVIKITAQGNFSGQIPEPVPPDSRAILQTKLSVSRDEKVTEHSVIATAEYTFRVRAQSPIPVFLDTVRIPWWNTQTDESSEAIIPARRINVGLPDRADLLAELALQDTGTNRFLNRIKSTPLLRLIIYTLAMVGLLYLLLTGSRFVLRSFRAASEHYHLKQALLSLKNNPQELYEHLNNLNRKQRAASDAMRALQQRLQDHLFDKNATPLDQKEIDDLIRQLSRQRVRNTDNAKHYASVLAEL